MIRIDPTAPSSRRKSSTHVRARRALLEALESRTLLSVTASHGYTATTFANAPTGTSQPDSIAVDGTNIYVGYQNGSAPDGSGGATSTIVQYSVAGTIINQFTVTGHNDGLKVDPATHLLWAMQNEDASPSLVIIDPTANTQTTYSFAAAPLAGGGYDDITFVGGNVYFSESNPANNPNTGPAIVQATLSGTTVNVSTILLGNATASNNKHKTVTLNLQDPDSMAADAAGDLVMTSQADNELVIVKSPGTASQSVSVLPLVGAKKAAVSVDDTLFPPTGAGRSFGDRHQGRDDLCRDDADGKELGAIGIAGNRRGRENEPEDRPLLDGVDRDARPARPSVPAVWGDGRQGVFDQAVCDKPGRQFTAGLDRRGWIEYFRRLPEWRQARRIGRGDEHDRAI